MDCASRRTKENISEFLKDYMKKNKVTIKQIADRISKDDENYYSRLRHCLSSKSTTEYSLDEIVALSEICNVSCHKLLTGEKDENRLVRADLGLSETSCDYLHALNQKRKKSPSEFVKSKIIDLLLSGKADPLLDDLAKFLFADFTKAYPISEGGMKWEEIDGVGFGGQNYTTVSVPVSLFSYAILQAITDDLNKLKGEVEE